MYVTRSTKVGSQTGVMLCRFATPTSAQTAANRAPVDAVAGAVLLDDPALDAGPALAEDEHRGGNREQQRDGRAEQDHARRFGESLIQTSMSARTPSAILDQSGDQG